MYNASLVDALNKGPNTTDPWAGEHKIPWHDKDFSRRMLREHLDQSHDLASRNTGRIKEQAAWIRDHAPTPCRILDLGCGPGLYAPHLARFAQRYLGLDFGPASIDHARRFADPGRIEFRLADLTETDFGGPHDLALLLYGEMNVFPPEDCLDILTRARRSLDPGGMVMVEVHSEAAVRTLGSGRSWQAAQSGLFSDRPSLCLVEGHWFENQRLAQQIFQVVDLETGGLTTYRSTTQSYSNEGYQDLLKQAGFVDPGVRTGWPAGTSDLFMLTARRP